MDSVITVKGQAAIPKAIREYLHLKPGTRSSFFCILMVAWFSCRNSLLRPYEA
jgi:hypothetical protein